MIVAAPTVEHSGTRFVIDLFHRAGFGHIHPQQPWGHPNVLVQAHFGQMKHWGKFEEILEVYDPPMVIPLRRLHSIFLSWERRQKGFRSLDNELALMTNMNDRDPYWLPVDAPDRDEWLSEINDGLGLHLETEWPIIGSDKRTAGKPEETIKDQSEYHRLKDKYDWFFSQVYRA